MKKTLFKKGLIVGIILFFICIGFRPVISNEIPVTFENEENSGCLSICKTYSAEKTLNRLGKNGLSSNVNYLNDQDDKPICELLKGYIDKYQDLLHYYNLKVYESQYGTFDYYYYNYLSYMCLVIGGFYLQLYIGLGCWDNTH
jgi:hypothetical protein